MQDKLISLQQACFKYDIPPSTWCRAAERGRVPRPTHEGHTAVRRFYTEAEAAEIAETLKNARRKPSGCISIKDTAAMMGLCYTTVSMTTRKHGIGQKYWGRVWLTDRDVKRLYQLIPSLAKGNK